MKIFKTRDFMDNGVHTKEYYFCGIRCLKKTWSDTCRKTWVFKLKTHESRYDIQSVPTSEPIRDIYLSDLMKYICPNNTKFVSDNTKSATVVIPVYNGTEHLKMLIPSLLKHTPNYVKIIMIDDCSTDKTTVDFLEKLKTNKRFIIKRNKKNLGFVATTNQAMSLVKTKYAVWLNTDTVVPEKWLERLLAQFNDHDKIATITPFTNSGVCFSFPNFGVDNTLTMPFEKIDKAFQRIQNNISINDIYSGTGFCMAIDMDCWRDVGELDYETFGKGYGEENDWCFRARRKGYRHLIAPNLFVWHKHGGSFLSEEKQRLCAEHQSILQDRYSEEMIKDVPAFFANDPWKPYRAVAGLLCCNKNTVIIIDLKQDKFIKSGALDYRQNMVKELKSDGYDVILVEYALHSDNEWIVRPASLNSDISIKLKDFSDIKLLLNILNVKQIIINNTAYLNGVENMIDILYEIKKQYDIKFSYKFHDYLSLCPSFFLLNKDCVSCDCFDKKTYCAICLKNNPYCTLKRENIELWRNKWNKLFSIIEEFDFFSEYTFNKVRKVYPIVENRYNIKYHTPLFSENATQYTRPMSDTKINIAFCGIFCQEKGALHFVELAKQCKAKNPNINFYVIGIDNPNIDHQYIEYIGGYTRDELGEILTKNNIHAVVHPSIANETFSYLAQELMILNVPFVCFNTGAHAERIKKYKYKFAEIADEVSTESLLKALKLLFSSVYKLEL